MVNYEEITKITQEIDGVAQILQDSFVELREEKNKLNYILDNIGDGIFALDEKKKIIYINSTGLDIFNVTNDILDKHLNYMIYEKTLSEAIDLCINSSKKSTFELKIKGSIFIATVKLLQDMKIILVKLQK